MTGSGDWWPISALDTEVPPRAHRQQPRGIRGREEQIGDDHALVGKHEEIIPAGRQSHSQDSQDSSGPIAPIDSVLGPKE